MKTQLRHFCTHALDDLIDFINVVGSRDGDFEQYTFELIKWVKQAVKFSYSWEQAFMVPEEVCAEWLTDEHPRLPFEFVAIEMEDSDDDIMDTVYVCANLDKIKHEIFMKIRDDLEIREDTEGFLVWPIVKPKPGQIAFTGNYKWYPSPCLGVVLPAEEMADWEENAPLEQKHIPSRYGSRGDEPCLFVQHLIDYEYTVEAIQSHLEGQGHNIAHLPFRDEFLRNELIKVQQSYGEAMLRDMKVVASMFTLLECKNVIHRTTPAPKMLNRKRHKKKRTPFFEYKTLVIDPDKPRVVSPSLGGNRLRRSPKLHLRRGHIRRLRSGDKTWVSPAMIGSKKRGIVLKDYEIGDNE